jgi:hypothetical protein
MRELLEKFANLERNLSRDRGEFSLFALFLREDAVDKWDLIVAAPWIDDNRKEALSYITNQIQTAFSSDELSSLSRVVLVDQTNPAVEALNQAIRVHHGQNEVHDSSFFGLPIRHGYIITSQRLNMDAPVPA